MKEMLDDIISTRIGGDIETNIKDSNIRTLEDYSNDDPILVKWVMLIKELWGERENNERIIILYDLIKDINFNEVDVQTKEKLTSIINGE